MGARYYGAMVLGCLHRTMAIKEWKKLKDENPVSLESALAAFDMFVLDGRNCDFDDVRRSNMVASFYGSLTFQDFGAFKPHCTIDLE